MRALAFLVVGLWLTGCASETMRQREAEAASFIGRSEEELVREVGVPSRIAEIAGKRFLAYEEQETRYRRPIPSFTRRWSRFGPATEVRPEELVVDTCETTFEVAGGRVTSFKLRGGGCG